MNSQKQKTGVAQNTEGSKQKLERAKGGNFLWKMATSEQLRVWPKDNNIVYFTRNDSGRYMPKSKISNSGRGISEPLPSHTDIWAKYSIPQIGIAEHTKGYYHSRRNENFYDLILVSKGVLAARFGNVKTKLYAGDFIVIPNKIVCDSSVPNLNTTLYWVHLGDTPHWRGLLGDSIRTGSVDCAAELVALMDAYRAELFGRKSSADILETIAQAIVAVLDRDFSVPRKKICNAEKYARSLLKKVAANPQQFWESKAQAQVAGLSFPVFNAVCSKISGKTFAAYVLQIRMAKALQILQKKNSSNAKIAPLVGYANAYSFAKAFKKYFGKSPTQIKE